MTARHYCCVPMCKNTSKNSLKLFFTVPLDEKRRRLWLKAIRRKYTDLSPKTNCYVCEDHFNLEEDMENYIQWKYTPGMKRKILKKDVVPHIFDCQPDKERFVKSRPTSINRKRKREVEEVFQLQSTSSQSNQVHISSSPGIIVEEVTTHSSSPIPEISFTTDQVASNVTHSDILPKFIDRSVQCKLRTQVRSKACQTTLIQTKDIGTDPISSTNSTTEPLREPLPRTKTYSESSTSSPSTLFSSFYQPSSDSSQSGKQLAKEVQNEKNKSTILQATKIITLENPKCYFGIPKACFPDLIKILNETLYIDEIKIFIVLQKIKRNISFLEIGHLYGISEAYTGQIFKTNIVSISESLENFIFWPESNLIKKKMPIAFRQNFMKVESIIDCFEIPIQQPQNPELQSHSFSKYKEKNTMKYLVSSTPDGLINFVSKGYAGRITDLAITEKCGYLNKLRPRSWVMADRGFKRVEKLLEPFKVTLKRPPSKESSRRFSKEEVRETKRIAALRIHIERVIERIREFKFLSADSKVNYKLIKYLDCAVKIACALVNLEGPLIK